MRADAVVVGAGPAGCTAARVLAEGGARVVIAERLRVPRTKVCGDGVLPDALRVLSSLGLAGGAQEAGHPVTAISLRSAAGSRLLLPLEGLVLRRERLDALLLHSARDRGAELLEEATLESFCWQEQRAVAARFTRPGGSVEVGADSFLLATGAAARPRQLACLEKRRGRIPVAVRGYARLADLPEDELLVAFPRELAGGYAWAFCVSENLWNVGCGLTASARRSRSLRHELARFAASLGAGDWVGEVRGAPLASSFPGLQVARANLAAVGDAAGLSLPCSGEGIGTALASGRLAARCLLEAPGEEGVRAYKRKLVRQLGWEFRAWRFGELFLSYPFLAELLIAKAQHPGARRRLASLLAGTTSASKVLTPIGLLRLLVQR